MSENSTHIKNRLSIFILQDGFSFLVRNDYSTVIAFENVKLSNSSSTAELLKLLKTKINSDFKIGQHIQELEVIYGNAQFSIVPQAYFEESHLPHYLKYSSKLIEGDDFSYDEITPIQANTVYIPYVNINNYLFDLFGSFEFTHVFTGLINKAFQKSRFVDEYAMVHVGHNLLYFTAFKNQKLLLANAFPFETAEDFAYYLLFTIEELKLHRENLKIEFRGHFFQNEENAALKILSTYLRHISFSNTPAPYTFENHEGFHTHFNLL
jgi:hypothetical protein